MNIDIDLNVVIDDLLDRIKKLTLENAILSKALESLSDDDLSPDEGV